MGSAKNDVNSAGVSRPPAKVVRTGNQRQNRIGTMHSLGNGGASFDQPRESRNTGETPRVRETRSNRLRAGINCIQLNMQHCKLASWTLAAKLCSESRYVALIQEPYCPKTAVLNVPKNARLHVGKQRSKVRACIFASEDIYAWRLTEFSNEDMVTIGVRDRQDRNDSRVIISSVYIPGESPDPPQQLLRDLVNHCDNENIPLIVGADVNGHHVVWGSTDVNKQGAAILDYLMETNLVILNKGNKPTFRNAVREEVLDATFSSAAAEHRVTNWRVSDEETSFADHEIIRFYIEDVTATVPCHYRNIRKTNWEKFKEELPVTTDDQVPQISSIEEVEQVVKRLSTSLKQSYESSCRLIKRRKLSKPVWWTPEISALRKEARRLQKKSRRTNSIQDREAAKQAARDLKREIRQSKRDSWRNHCTQMEGLAPTAKLLRILKSDKSIQVGDIKRPDGSFTNTPQEALNALLDHHFPEGPQNMGNQRNDPHLAPTNWELIERIVTEEKVRASFNTFQPLKAPGPDGHYPIALQKAMDKIIRILIRLFSACLSLGYVPEAWRKTRVAFLPKPGKENYSLPSSYRPISLSSFLLKGLERLVLWHLMEEPLRRHPIHRYQFAYKAGVSTDNALHELVYRIEDSYYSGQYAILLLLDIDGAFSNAVFHKMFEPLEERGVDKGIQNWIAAMLTSRTASATLQGVEVEIPVRRGCPQGGILSPTLWNLTVDTLLVKFDASPTYAGSFADDINALTRGQDLPTVTTLAQNAIGVLEEWANDHHLRFSVSKTECMVITRRRKWENPELKLYGEPIKVSKRAKALGVILDSKLSWKPNIDHRIAKATVALNCCRKVVGTKWGIKPKTMAWVYKQVIRPAISYGCLIWFTGTETKTAQNALSKIQRKALLCIASAFPSTPTAGLEALLDVPPLHIFLRGEALKTAHRLQSRGQWKGTGRYFGNRKSHVEACNRLLSQFPILSQAVDSEVPTLRFNNNFQVKIPERQEFKTPSFPPVADDVVHCYTDGSRTGDNAGAGFLIETKDWEVGESHFLGSTPTVFQAEVVAVQRGALKLTQLGVTETYITFYVDNQSTLKSMKQHKVRGTLVKQCRDQLHELGQQNQVTLSWIPAHSGHEGNERADSLAKRGARNNSNQEAPELPIPKNLCKKVIDDWVRRMHTTAWQQRTDCRQTKMMCSAPDHRRTRDLLSLSRLHLNHAIQMLTGHCKMNRHLHLCGLHPIELCLKCDTEELEETPYHHLGQCKRYEETRCQVFGSAQLTENQVSDLPIHRLVTFLKRTGRLDEPPTE